MESFFIFLGILGALTVIAAYGLLAAGKLQSGEAHYQWMNVLGTAGILISLITQWNLASFVANTAWLLIGLVGLVRIYCKRSAA